MKTDKKIGRVVVKGNPQYGQRIEKPKKGKGSYRREKKWFQCPQNPNKPQ